LGIAESIETAAGLGAGIEEKEGFEFGFGSGSDVFGFG
jgi:hypothetical protein